MPRAKFARDRQHYLRWLFEAKKRFPARSHTRYWNPLERYASEELNKALHLNDF